MGVGGGGGAWICGLGWVWNGTGMKYGILAAEDIKMLPKNQQYTETAET